MRYFLPSAVVLIGTTNAGCASLGVRMDAYGSRTAIYPATAVDVGLVTYITTRPFMPVIDPWFAPDAQEGLVFLFAPAAILDLPFAIALDTLLLPYDIYTLGDHQADDGSLHKAEPGFDAYRSQLPEANPPAQSLNQPDEVSKVADRGG